MVKNFEDMYNPLDRIPACDGQTERRTDRLTSCHGIVRAVHTRRAVKVDIFWTRIRNRLFRKCSLLVFFKLFI